MKNKTLPRLRPSSSDRWLNCALSPYAKEGGTSEAAEEGTRLHKMAEDAVSECLNGTYPIEGAKPRHKDPDVQFAVDQVWRLVREGTRVFLESPVTMAAGDDLISGTADVVLLHADKTADILDYKFGRGIRVDANSDQLAIYAAGLLQMYREHGYGTVNIHIIQPRHHKGVWLDSYEHRRTHSTKIIARSIEAIEAIRRGDAPRSGDWCRWCPHKPECPAQAADMAAAFDELSLIAPAEAAPALKKDEPALDAMIDGMIEDGLLDRETGEILPVAEEAKPEEKVECRTPYNGTIDDLFNLLEDIK